MTEQWEKSHEQDEKIFSAAGRNILARVEAFAHKAGSGKLRSEKIIRRSCGGKEGGRGRECVAEDRRSVSSQPESGKT